MSGRLKRALRGVGLTALVVFLGALVSATLYWTYFDPRWVTFLCGVLFASVLATVSRLARSEWRTARRTRQLARANLRLEEESARARRAVDLSKVCEARLRVLGDALPQLVFFVDHEDRCRYINRAAAQKAKLFVDQIEGRPLQDVLDGTVYQDMKPYLDESHQGKAPQYEMFWGGARYSVRHAPFAHGLCMMFADSTPAVVAPLPYGKAESLYLSTLAREDDGWLDPEAKLTQAMRNNEFLLLQQKIVSVQGTQEYPHYEILLRLKEEEEGMLPPGGFFPVAERFGLMEKLDRWVVSTLIGFSLERQRADPQWKIPVYCVNLSAAALLSPEFPDFVAKEITDRKFKGHCLCFEIAEPEVIALRTEVYGLMAKLKPLGCRFTMDAFGSVKVSFAPLEGLAFDFLKMDGIIVQNLVSDPAQLIKAQAVTKVCHQLGIHIIAEFVEDQETLSVVRGMGIEYVQGFGIGAPELLGTVSVADPAMAAAA